MRLMEEVRVGFVGTGGIAGYHLNYLAKMADVRVVALYDVVAEKAQQVAERFGARAYPSLKALFQEAEMDAVYICIPPFAHGEPEWLALERGLPMYVEKPVHLNLEEARRIARAIEEKGLISSVGYQTRYADVVDRLRTYLAPKQVGMVWGYWMGGMPGTPWWRRKEQSGGQIVEQTTHLFDIARLLFGEVEQVWAIARTGLMTDVPDYDVEDASAVHLRFRSGLIGTFFSACFLRAGGRVGMTIFCKDAVVEYQHGKAMKAVERNATLEAQVGNDFGFEANRTFIEAVKSGDGSRIRSPYSDAVKTLAVTLAANESIRRGGEPVEVPAV